MGTTLLSFVFVLGFLVFVHELGHFAVAKWFGVKVHTFSIGFGKRLFGWKRGDTDYRISAIPLGGYVKMAGELPEDESTGAPDEFSSKSVLQRMGIILAGPAMNLIWAVIFIAMIFYFGIDRPVYLFEAPRVSAIAPDSPAAQAGLQAGDLIQSIEGTEVGTWQEAIGALPSERSETVGMAIERGGISMTFSLAIPDSTTPAGLLGALPHAPAVVDRVQEDGAAFEAGFQAMDKFLSIDDEPVHYVKQVVDKIQVSAGVPLRIIVEREGSRVELTATPRRQDESDVGLLGIVLRPETTKVRYGLGESIERSIDRNVQLAGMLFTYIGRIFAGRESGDQIGGPILIAQVAGEAARSGWITLLGLMGFLSLQLGLLNLLPIPILDGGHMVLLTIEGVSGRPVSMRVRGIAQFIGLFMLLSIMAFAFFNDITRLFSG